MMAARRYLIPFPEPPLRFDPEDTVCALPMPERLFQLPRRKPVLPRSVSTPVCAAGIAAAFALGTSVGAMVAERRTPALAAAAAHAPVVQPETSSAPELRLAAPAVAAGSLLQQSIVRPQRIRFRLAESKQFQSVGPLRLRLKKADAKRQMYTLTLQVRDKLIELQNRALAEPVRLYTAGAAPREILIQRIEPDYVEGYLRLPGGTR
jgi:hypothetical protein